MVWCFIVTTQFDIAIPSICSSTQNFTRSHQTSPLPPKTRKFAQKSPPSSHPGHPKPEPKPTNLQPNPLTDVRNLTTGPHPRPAAVAAALRSPCTCSPNLSPYHNRFAPYRNSVTHATKIPAGPKTRYLTLRFLRSVRMHTDAGRACKASGPGRPAEVSYGVEGECRNWRFATPPRLVQPRQGGSNPQLCRSSSSCDRIIVFEFAASYFKNLFSIRSAQASLAHPTGFGVWGEIRRGWLVEGSGKENDAYLGWVQDDHLGGSRSL